MTTPANPDASPPTGAAEAALEWVQDGMKLGLGTGRAASAFVEALARRVAEGLRVTGIPTSEATGQLALLVRQIDDPHSLECTHGSLPSFVPSFPLPRSPRARPASIEVRGRRGSARRLAIRLRSAHEPSSDPAAVRRPGEVALLS